MKLVQFHVTMFQSILDSGPIQVEDVTCLVGKNEAGKSAILKALYKLHPIRDEDANFNVTDDYPRAEVNDYEDEVARGKRTPRQVVEAQYELGDDDVEAVESVFGPSFLRTKFLTRTKFYNNKRVYGLSVDEQAAITFMSRNLTGD